MKCTFTLQACLRHPESLTSKENRDTVFCQMRRAMDLIHYVVKDGVLDSGGGGDQNEDWDAGKTVSPKHALPMKDICYL